jgi:ATP-dependent protease HslVU (ClpYQ) peptidase subunit
VTLIAALPCKEAIVLCADSQETIGQYRCSRQKIAPERMGLLGQFATVIAGSGYSHLVDALIASIRDRLSTMGTSSLVELKHPIEEELKEFHKNELPHQPKKYRYLDLIIAAVSTEKTYAVWTVKGMKLKPISDTPIISGWNIPFYAETIKQFHDPKMAVPQAVLAGIHVLTIAESTSNDVRGPMSVSIMGQDGVYIEGSKFIQTIQDRLRRYARLTHGILLTCADTGTNLKRFEELLRQFTEDAIRLHKGHLIELVRAVIQDPRGT